MSSSLYSEGTPSDGVVETEAPQPRPLNQLPQPPSSPQRHDQLQPLEPPRSPPHAAGLFVMQQPCPRGSLLGGTITPGIASKGRLLLASAGSVAANLLPPPPPPQQQQQRGSLLDQLLGAHEQGLQALRPPAAAPLRRSVARQQAPPATTDGRPRLMLAGVHAASPAAAAADGTSQQGSRISHQQPGLQLPSMLEMILGRPVQQQEAQPEEPLAPAATWDGSVFVHPVAEPAAEAVDNEVVDVPARAARTGRIVQWKQRRAPAAQQLAGEQAQQHVEEQREQQHLQQPPQGPLQQEQAQPRRPAVHPRGLQGPPHRQQLPCLAHQPSSSPQPQQARAVAPQEAWPAAQVVQRPAPEPLVAPWKHLPPLSLQPSSQELRSAAASATAAAAAAAAPPAEQRSQQAVSPQAAAGAAEAAGRAAAVAEACEASSQDTAGGALPTPYDGPRDLGSFLPAPLAAAFHGEGVDELRPWQASCLSLPGVMPREEELGAAQTDRQPCNLVFSAPTGDGKSLVAEVIMLRALAAEKNRCQGVARKAMLVLSLVSACNAQARRMEKLLQPLGLEVERAYGSHHSETWLQRNTGVVVCTPERAQMLLNRKLAAGVDPTHLFSVVVFDEVHEVAGGRGHTYRSLLSKLRYMQATSQSKLKQQASPSPANGGSQAVIGSQADASQANRSQASRQATGQPPASHQPMRIVCMSATRTGQSATARLLGAQLYVKATQREVQLQCYLVLRDGRVLDEQEQVVRQMPRTAAQTVLDCVADLCAEAAAASQQALVFCGTKAGCEVAAKSLARALDGVPELSRWGELAPTPAGPDATPCTPTLGTATPTRAGFAAQLRQLGSQGDSKALALGGLVERGVAFHHAGMPRPVQQLVLEAFRTGAISFLCCTTTLAMSVNLPAERIIFRDAWVSRREMHLDPDRFHQMAGRAGRPGMATLGQAFLLAGKEQPPEPYLRGLLRSEPGKERPAPVLHDCSEEVLCSHLLEAIAGCGVRTAQDINRFLKCTYAGAANMQGGAERLPDQVGQSAKSALRWLGRPSWPRRPAGQAEDRGDRDLALVEYDAEGACFRPLPLGRAVFASSLLLEEALSIRAEMASAMKQLDLTSDLQPCFLSVSPYHLPVMSDRQWRKLFEEWSHAPVSERDSLLRLAGSSEESGFAERFQHFLVARQLEAGPQDGHVWHMRAPRPEEQRCQRLCQRILAALAVRALLQEGATEEGVRQQFGFGHLGRVFADMREHCGVFAGKAAAFAAMVGQSRGAEGWTYLAAVMKKFQGHLRSGSKLELLSLRELEDVDEATARLLYNAGLMDLQAVADAEEATVYRALLNRPQGKSTTQQAEQRARRQAREIQQAAREAVEDPTRALRSRGKQVLKKRRRVSGQQQQQRQRARLSKGRAVEQDSSEETEAEEGEREEEEENEVGAAEGEDGGIAAVEKGEEGRRTSSLDQQMEEAGVGPDCAAEQPANGKLAGNHRRTREGSSGLESSSPAPKRSRWAPLPLPVPWQQRQKWQQRVWEPEMQQRPPGCRVGSQEPSSSSDSNNDSESDGLNSDQGGSDSKAAGGGALTASTSAAMDAAALSTPAPGACDLRLVCSPRDLRQLCAALQGKQLNCLGFALQTAVGGSNGMMLPPPSRPAAAAAQQGGQAPQQPQQPAELPAAGTLLGVAISWRSSAAAYIPLRGSDGGLDPAATEAVACLLDSSRSGMLGATCFRASLDVQSQMPALQDLLHPEAQRWQRLPAQVVDVRLAAWLLHPSSSALYSGAGSGSNISGRPDKDGRDSRLEGLLDRVLNKVAGQGSAAAEAARASWASLTSQAASAAVVAVAQQQTAAERQPLLASAPPPGWLQACQVAAASRTGWELLLPQLQSVPRLMAALLEQEQPLALVLAAMERAGMGCNPAAWERLVKRTEARLKQIVQDVHQLPDVQRRGRQISLISHSQVPKLLFHDLQLRPPPCAKKLKRGWFSTDKEAIGRMIALGQTHPVLPLILEYRKANSTLKFVNKLLESARACNAAGAAGAAVATAVAAAEASGPGAGPRIRHSLLQTNSDTGRLVMDDPSLQCVPNAHELLLRTRDPTNGREVQPSGAAAEACPRRGFVAAPGCVLLSADYKQAELRLMAHFSGDEELRRMCEDGQQDVFELLAARWLKHGDASQVTRAERNRAKAVTYALIYGLGNGRLGEDLNLTAKEAAAEKERFLASLPKLRAFLAQVVEDCRHTGYVEMLSGRRRWLPGINSPQWEWKGRAERAAVNTVVQGSAADVAKRAMLALHARLPSEDACLVNMVHDELLLEVRADRLHRVAALVRDAMEGAAPELTVPLRVQLRAGASWGELQPLELQPLPESEDMVGVTQAGGPAPLDVVTAPK